MKSPPVGFYPYFIHLLGLCRGALSLYPCDIVQGERQGAVGGDGFRIIGCCQVYALLVVGRVRLPDSLKAVWNRHGNVGCSATDVPCLRLGFYFHILL
ncbi:hypothetical protein AB9N12_15165 [Bacteroides sp. AN502(2024)]|uniref:hypothetical protein n=1 Tax=Bacteroides sp. AN502(2024) TaxID=3160599 RepID=UPI003516E66F